MNLTVQETALLRASALRSESSSPRRIKIPETTRLARIARTLLVTLLAATVLAQDVKLPGMTQLQEGDTFRSARLTPSEKEQVFAEIAGISFDTPDSWESELRVRRVILGGVEEG